MKPFFVFFIFSFAIFGNLTAAPRAKADLADKIREAIDEAMPYIPEPYTSEDQVIYIHTSDDETGTIAIENISISGFTAMDTNLTYDDDSSRLDFTFKWGSFNISCDIQVNGLILMDNHISVKIHIKDVKNEGYAVVSEDSKKVTEISLVGNIGKMHASPIGIHVLLVANYLGADMYDIQGLLNNDEISQLVSVYLNENAAALLYQILPVITPYYTEALEDLINIVLDHDK